MRDDVLRAAHQDDALHAGVERVGDQLAHVVCGHRDAVAGEHHVGIRHPVRRRDDDLIALVDRVDRWSIARPTFGEAPHPVPRDRLHTTFAEPVAELVERIDYPFAERLFPAALEVLKRLRAMPRVRKGKEIKFNDGPQTFSRHYVEPKDGVTQTFHIHLEEYGPGGHSQKHGHVNEAAFYILDGKGYEIHDGIRYDWKAGDIAIVHNNCVHQHFNADPKKPARALVIKTKPMYMFMNMLFQKQVEPRPPTPAQPGGPSRDAARWRPPSRG